MSISTTLGDTGRTQLGDRRVSKASAAVEALGALDELVSAIGFARSLAPSPEIRRRAEDLQRLLFEVSASIGAPASAEPAAGARGVPAEAVAEVTGEVRRLESREGMLSDWALPGGHTAAAAFDLARTACRRAERALFRLAESGEAAAPSPQTLAFVNRLSDLLWLYGRVLERDSGVDGALRRPDAAKDPAETKPKPDEA